MNKPIELSALASENLKMLSPELLERFRVLFHTANFRTLNGKRLQGMQPETYTVQLDDDVHVIYRLLDQGTKLQVLNIYQRNSVFDRV